MLRFAILSLVALPQMAAASDKDIELCGSGATKGSVRIEACTRGLDGLNAEFADLGRRLAITFSLRGWAWLEDRKIDNALSDFSEAIRLDSGYLPPYEARGNIYRDTKRCQEAIADYNEVLQNNPAKIPVYVSRAACFLEQNESERAVVDLNEVVRRDERNTSGLALVAQTLMAGINLANNKFDEALNNLNAAIALDSKQASLYLDRAAAWSGKGEAEKALADYDQTIMLDRNNADGFALTAHTLKARLQSSRGNLDVAITEYGYAIKMASSKPDLYIDRASLSALKGSRDSALADYDEAIKVNPKLSSSYLARGDFRRNNGEYSLAIADYNQAIERQPDDLTAYGHRALVHFYAGAFAKSASDFQRITDAQANAYPILMLYVSKSRDGDAREAKSAFTKNAAKLKPGEWPYPLVELYLGKKSVKDAEASSKTPGEKCEAQFYIGEWQLLKKEKAEATKALQAAADNCPKDFVEYRAALEELKRFK